MCRRRRSLGKEVEGGVAAGGLYAQQWEPRESSVMVRWVSKSSAHHNGDERSSLLATVKGEVTPALATASGGVENLKTQREPPAASANTHDECGIGLHLLPVSNR